MPDPLTDPTEAGRTQLGATNFSNITDSQIQVQGSVDAGLHAAGDIIGRDKITNITYQHIPAQAVDPQRLAAAQALLARLAVDELPRPAPLPPGSRMGLPRNPHFVGREAELKTLAGLLKAGETAAIGQVAAATGLGGIGKTQLAAEFVHRYGQFFAGGVFWLNFADPTLVRTELAECGRRGYLNLSPDFAQLELTDQLNLVLSAWQSPLPRLLVFDNCEEETLLQQCRPPSGGCRILVTSRRQRWNRLLEVQSLPLAVLARAESLALLHKYRPDLPLNDPSLAEIAAELGDLPLALDLAGNFLSTYQEVVTSTAYLAQLRDKGLLAHPSLQGRGTPLSPPATSGTWPGPLP